MKNQYLTDSDLHYTENTLTIGDLWGVICRGKWLILLCLVIIAGLAAFYISIAPRKFESTSVVLVQPKERDLEMQVTTSAASLNDVALIPSQIQVIQSREIIGRALARLGYLLAEDETGAPTPQVQGDSEKKSNSPQPKIISLSQIMRDLSVTQIEKSRAIEISFQSTDAKFAADLSNGLAQEYIETLSRWQFENLDTTNSWLQERVKELQKEIRENQLKIVEYRKREGLVDSLGSDLVDQDISELSKKLTEAKAELSQAEARLNEFNDNNASAPSVLSSPLIQRLQEREATISDELANLADTLGASHPDYIAAQARLNEIRSQISSESYKISSAARKNRDVAAENVARLETRLNGLKQEYNRSGQASVELNALIEENETNQELLNSLNSTLKKSQSQVEERLQDANAVIISQASISAEPSSPKVKLILIASIIAGLGIGTALVIIRDQFDETIFNGSQLERITQVSNISLIPKVSKSKKIKDIFDYPVKAPQSLFTESLRAISTYLSIQMEDSKEKPIFNFTSVVSGEGKTTTVSAVARQMQQDGKKVLLIDCDVRHPILTKKFKLEGKPGLSDILNKQCKPVEGIFKDSDSGLYIIGTGTTRDTNIISKGKATWQEAMELYLTTFDVILLDSPPALAVSDSLLIASSAQNIICVSWKKTKLRQVKYLIQSLLKHDCKLFGTIITMVDIKKSTAYHYVDNKYYKEA